MNALDPLNIDPRTVEFMKLLPTSKGMGGEGGEGGWLSQDHSLCVVTYTPSVYTSAFLTFKTHQV